VAKIQDGKKRILYVEDHRDTAELVAVLLCNHEVVVAGNKAEGLRRTADERFDLYIFDYDLPDGTGIDLCHSVRTNDNVTPIVICTASPALTEQESLAVGAQRFIKKGDDFIQSLEEAASQFLSSQNSQGESDKLPHADN
jgi:DNA-binding response OmpR family regulator